MSWAINGQGSKTHMRRIVTDSCIAANRPAEEIEQFEAAKAFILIQIASMPAKHAIKLEAFGHMGVVSPADDPTKREVLASNVHIDVEPIMLPGMGPND